MEFILQYISRSFYLYSGRPGEYWFWLLGGSISLGSGVLGGRGWKSIRDLGRIPGARQSVGDRGTPRNWTDPESGHGHRYRWLLEGKKMILRGLSDILWLFFLRIHGHVRMYNKKHIINIVISPVFFKQKTAYEIMPSLVGSEMCIRDRDRPTK